MTITSANYNTYPTQNTSLAKQMAQNATQSYKTTNPANLVLDKSEAVSKVLGYGVDSEGYFTSDFNEIAGLPKDYRIYAKSAENFVNFEQRNDYILSTHSQVDFAKTLGNAYKIFSQLIPQTSNSSFSQEDLQNLSYAYKVDKQTLEVTQIYDYEEYKNNFDTDGHLLLTFNTTNYPNFEPISNNSIFNSNSQIAKLDNKPYLNADGSIDKSGLLVAFTNNTGFFGVGKSFFEGETKLLGKLTGFDDSVSKTEIKEFYDFMNANKLQNAFMDNPDWSLIQERLSMQLFIRKSNNVSGTELSKRATELAKEYEDLINSDISLEEFKGKYLEFKEKHDEFVKDLKEAEAKTENTNSSDSTKTKNTEDSEEKDKKSFTPIEAESSKETYKDTNTHNILALAKSQQMADMISILFNQKSSSNSAFKELQKFIGSKTGIDLDSLSNMNSLREFVALKTKKVDIEA